uniref:Protein DETOXIFICATION n=1 Tax=Fagus sylvatica TaxID=28930 RepID=A0A2N9F5N8_FAGSY
MSANTSLDSATPLLEASDHDGEEEEEETNRGCCKKLLDMKEAKNQVLFALPMILTNVFCYSITLVSAMFAGHLGELELAGATLANSWAVVTGIAFMR